MAALLADAEGDSSDALRLARSALDIAEATRIERYCLMLMADTAWIQLHANQAEDAVSGFGALLRRIDQAGRESLTRAHALAGMTAALVASGRLAQACAGAGDTVDALRQSGIFLARGDIFAWLAAVTGHAEVAAQVLGATERFHARGETRRDSVCEHAREQARSRLASVLPATELAFWYRQGESADESVLARILVRALKGEHPHAT